MRLIDADALKKAIFDHCRSEAECLNHFYYDENIIALINNAPTIIWCGETSEGLPIMDLRPRPCAKWDQDEDDNSLTCMGCGCRLWANDIIDGEAHFCPNCGAKMKGGEEE